MSVIDLFRIDAPDNYENYGVLPETVVNPMNKDSFDRMEKQEYDSNVLIDKILGI